VKRKLLAWIATAKVFLRDVREHNRLSAENLALMRENSRQQGRLERLERDFERMDEEFRLYKQDAVRDLQALTGIKSYVTTTPEGQITKRVIMRMLQR
jgi:hypothetical protein